LRGYQIAGTNYAYTAMQAPSRPARAARSEGEGA
jgi:hypothetical protein